MARDPVCGMKVDKKKPSRSSTYNGTLYFFCSIMCKAEFDKNPSKYAR